MGELLGSFIFPHPPLIIPEIGKSDRNKVQNTINAFEEEVHRIAELRPQNIIVITPHGPVFQDAVCISVERELKGDFKDFRHPEIGFEFLNNPILAERIIINANKQGIAVGKLDEKFARAYKISNKLDHGALVPLYYIRQRYADFRLIHITMGFLPYEELYLFGTCIAKAIEESAETAVIAASGDLSHRLIKGAPSGYNPKGREFDEKLVEYIGSSDVGKIMAMEHDLVESAGECGLRSFIIMYGALDGREIDSRVLSYEGPFGVGYCVADIKPGNINEDRKLLKKLFEDRNRKMESIRKGEDPYVYLARMTLETYVETGRTIRPSELDIPDELLKNKAAVFVSIKKHGQLRGCIGTTAPTKRNIAEEIIYNAISAGMHDPRFYPVQKEELGDLVYSVDVLTKPEPIKTKEQLDPVKYGVIVRKGFKSGLLLPNLEGVDTVEQQISIALEKAGISEDEKYSMERFEVVRHK